MKKYSQIKSKLEAFFVIIIASVLVSHASASYGSHGEQVEIFQCGSLGDLTLTTLLESPALELRNTAKAYLFISERNLSYTGVIHNFVGGNDRTFTISSSQNFRRLDETTKGSLVALSIVSGYVYGKERDQITFYTPNAVKTCIRANP